MLPERKPSEIASGRWQYILGSLGIADEYLRNKHGPCPVCGGKDRYRFDDKNGHGTFICNQCGSGDGYKLLQLFHGWTFKESLDRVREVVGDAPIQKSANDSGNKMASVRKVWNESLKVERGDPVWAYLNRRLGLEIVPSCLRHHPALTYAHEDGSFSYHPALVAAVTYPDGTGAAVHRIYLNKSGEKADVPSVKKLLSGGDMHTASVKLSRPTECIGIAEGIETALAASRLFDLPVWACVSSSLMESWAPPETVKRVCVFGDNDAKFGGQKSAYAIAHKLACKGFDVDVRIPDVTGEDWADEIR